MQYLRKPCVCVCVCFETERRENREAARKKEQEQGMKENDWLIEENGDGVCVLHIQVGFTFLPFTFFVVFVQISGQQSVPNLQTCSRKTEDKLEKITRDKSRGKLCLLSRDTWFTWFVVTVQESGTKHWTRVKTYKTQIIGVFSFNHYTFELELE